MAMMAELGLPTGPVRQQIAAALDLVVHTARFADGSRKVVSITEVRGLRGNGLDLHEVFAFVRSGIDAAGAVEGSFVGRAAPACLDRICAAGAGDGLVPWPTS
jgi:pilus assembly protein CpaF